MNSTIIEIANAKFLATPEQVQQLARAHWAANDEMSQGSRTYLAVLVALVQRRVKRSRRQDDVVAVFENLAASMYQDVIAGVSEPDMSRNEVNRRGTFARTATSTLRTYLKAGHPLDDLDPATVSKAALRKVGVPPEPDERAARVMTRATKSVRSVINRMMKTDRGRAMRELRLMINQLSEQLMDMEHQADAESINVTSHTLHKTPAPRQEPARNVVY